MFRFKSIVSVAIAVAVLISAVPVTVAANGLNLWQQGGFSFAYDANDRMTITQYSGPGGSITIPAQSPTGSWVYVIGPQVFQNRNLNAVTFESGSRVQVIGSAAFRGSDLSSINLPTTVTTIGEEAFRGATRLTQITLPQNLTTIGRRAFEDTRLTRIEIPDRVTYIGDDAFRDITTLREAHFMHLDGRDVSLGFNVFNRAHNDFLITHRPQASHFGRNWYPPHQTFSTDSTEIREADWRWTSLAGNNAMITGYNPNSPLATAEEIEIPSRLGGRNVTRIQNRAFDHHPYLREVTIPSSITVIYPRAFNNNRELRAALFRHSDGSNVEVSQDAFVGSHHNFSIFFPYGARGFSSPTWRGWPAQPDNVDGIWEFTPLGGGLELMVTNYNGGASIVEIPSAIDGRPVRYIGSETFRDNTNIVEIIIPDSIVHIQANAVFNAPNLRTARLRHMHADTLDMSGLAFSGVHSDFTIVFPGDAEGFTTPTWVGFPSERDLISAHWEYEISGNIATVIGYRGEEQYVEIPAYISGSPVRVIAAGTFRDNDFVERVTIPANVNTIESNAFHDVPNLYAARLLHTNANQINNFEQNSFVGVAPHFRLIIPNNATGFTQPVWNGYFVVPEADDFTSVEGDFEFLILREPIPGMAGATRDVIVITRFLGFDQSVEIPATLRSIPVTALGDFAFLHNLTVEEVIIPSSVMRIGHSAFLGARYLETVYFRHMNGEDLVLHTTTFRYTADNFSIVYPATALGFATPLWQGWPARPDNVQAPPTTPPTGTPPGTDPGTPGTPPSDGLPPGGLLNPFINTTRTLNAQDPHITRDGRVLHAPIFRLEPFAPNRAFSTSYVMVSVIADILGLDAAWNAPTRTATFSGYNAQNQFITMSLVIDSTTMWVNGVPREVRASAGVVPAIVRDDRTFVPVSVFQEVFGVTIQWNGEARTVTINP